MHWLKWHSHTCNGNHSLCLNFIPPFKKWRNKSEETFENKREGGSSQALTLLLLKSRGDCTCEVQTLAASQHKCQPTGLQAGFQATVKPPEELLCFISSVGICLIRFTEWCLPEWQPWVCVANACSIQHVPLPELISFLLCFIYLGWHYDTQSVLILEMFSGLEISV